MRPHRAEVAGVCIASAARKHKELVRGDAARCRLGAWRKLRASEGKQKARLSRSCRIEAEQAQRGFRDRCEDGCGDGGGGEPGKAGANEASSASCVLGIFLRAAIVGSGEDPQVFVIESERCQAHAQSDHCCVSANRPMHAFESVGELQHVARDATMCNQGYDDQIMIVLRAK